MPLAVTRPQRFRRSKKVVADWNNFRKGLNLLLDETEIKEDELAKMDDIVLVGKGVPTKRWGYETEFQSGATGIVRGLSGYYQADGTNELVAVTDYGYLTIQSGASYTQRTGASWPSGYSAEITQLDDNMYIVQEGRELVRYSTPTLTSFPTISIPSGVVATQISGVTGSTLYSYRISAYSDAGETLASTAIELDNQPASLEDGAVKVSWSAVSTASGVLQGYSVYGRDQGDERFISSVGASVTEYVDDGDTLPAELTFPRTSDTTGGVKCKYITRFQDRLVYAGIDGEPSKVIVSGKVPFHEQNNVANGGNYINIEPDAGDNITGIVPFGNRIIVFKERSIWQVTLSTLTVGNFYVTQPEATLITSANGCVAPRSIVPVENDVFFLSRKGIYVLGYEPNLIADVLRTNELSAKIRPFFDEVPYAQSQAAVGAYLGFKYIISFPGKDETMVYDRERLSWTGPWSFDTRIIHTYYNSSGTEIFLMGQDDGPTVYELSADLTKDDGAAITTLLRTKKSDFGDWSLYKLITDVFSNWRNVYGTIKVNIRLEDREGLTLAAKDFSVNSTEGTSGYGAGMWGESMWGDSSADAVLVDEADIVKWVRLHKLARRIQISVETTGINDNYELLGFKIRARPLDRGLKGSDWRVY